MRAVTRRSLRALAVGAAVLGTATGAGATEFGITGLLTSGSNTIEIGPITGENRGGIAVSSSHVFYTGDASTGRFALTDLSGGAALGAFRDFMFSDLSNGKVYVFGNGSSPLIRLQSFPDTATTLLEIDGGTGTLTGASITLSEPLSLISGAGIYSGWERMILHNTYTGEVVDIHLPSGTVTSHGIMQFPPGFPFLPFSQCDFFGNSGNWGVAEQVGTELWIVYVERATEIVRRRVPDGFRRTVASFSDLGQMCTFILSPSIDRWYFSHPGASQFGSGGQILGYADATWSNSFPDADGDGTYDAWDNCPTTANPGQSDCDGDSLGDACDPDTVDPDGDHFDTACDNCPTTPNPGQQDSDGDTFGDACDACFGPGPDDTDGDGDCDGFDNCPTIANSGQEDINGDGIGDACSPQVTIGAVTSDGDDLTAIVSAASPLGLSVSGTVAVCDGTDVTDLTITLLAAACDFVDIDFTVNGTTVLSASGPVPCQIPFCGAQVATFAVPFSPLTPGVNRLGLRKNSTFPFGFSILAWAYATVTTSSGTHRVELFDAGGGNDYDNPDICAQEFEPNTIDTQASTPFLCDTQASQSWSGGLPPCGIDVSGLANRSYSLVVDATDGAVASPSKDVATFTHAGESDLFINTSCGDANLCTIDCDIGGGNCSHAPAGTDTVCRAAAGGCDVPEHCDGVTTVCPTDTLAPAGTVCRMAGGVCDLAEQCSGGSAACPSDAKSSAVCRPAADMCDIAESCDGVSNACPSDLTLPDGTSCADGPFCNGAEQCLSGSCQPAADPCPLGCDEVNDQCVSICPPIARSGCTTAERSILIIRNNDNDARDTLLWKWSKGQPTELSEFGDPQNSADYVLCVYGGASESLLADGDLRVPRSTSKWTPRGSTGWSYDDAAAAESGVRKLIVKSSARHRSKAKVKGNGTELPDPALPVAATDLPLLVQLLNSQTSTCLESSFDSGDVIRNDGTQLKAKTR